jgi:signal transduction histidine kinase
MRRGPFFLWISTGIVVVALSLAGFVNLGSRPGIPKPYSPGAVIRVDSQKVHDIRDLDYIFSLKKIGDPVEIELRAAGVTKVVRVALGRYYPELPWMFLVIGGFAFLIGFAVLWLRPEDRRARIFYCASQAFGSAVLISGDVYGLQGKILPFCPGVLFNFAYPLAPALLWRFCRTFSTLREKRWLYSFWAVPVTFGMALNAAFLISEFKPSVTIYQTGQAWFFVFRAYVILAIVAAVVELVRSFRASDSDEVRAQIKWVFFGMIAGLAPFVFLYQLPITVLGNGREILSEDVSNIFMLLVPVTLAVAILKHRLLNINVVIRRSLVYSLLTIVMVGFYLLAVEVLGAVFARAAQLRPRWIPAMAAIFVALAFQPGRRRIQLLVDKTFFRQDYDYRRAVLSFIPRAEKMMSPDDLVGEFAGAVGKALPVEKIGIIVYEPAGDGPQLVLRAGLDEVAARALLSCPPPSGDAWAREESVRTAQGLDFSEREMLRTLRWEVILSLPFESGPLAGFAALGRKKSGQRFTSEDLDLVRTLAGELTLGLRRIRLQEEVVYERASREKADDLSRIKTEFISSVSHELRTPMSSLQGLSELLGSGKVADEARRERLLQLMAGECGRLSRFLHNVLDFGKIEREAKLYDMRPAPLQPLIQEVIELSRSGIPEGELLLRAEMPDEPVVLEADQDAVRQALLNLVDNAIKYGEGKKEVTVRLVQASESVEIQVEDHGIGIDPADRERIFEAFFRSPRAASQNPRGVGLGLNIVKHIMDAHGGRVGLRSEPGQGSTFSLIFPRRGSP